MVALQHIDFHAVEPHQREIDARLANWGAWCNGREASATAPMWQMTPPAARVRADIPSNSTDTADAARIAKAMAYLPADHRAALSWCYVKPVSPKRACQSIGTTMEGLAKLLRDGRQMLINRNV